ncbi:MBOAT family protein [Verrucomicrobiaceae bacterium 5K15]|uniref:MBOAT family protein n=1 Tax=Oceaniferula flava TaxID=2800421 RepID=A0AAE2S8X8_9BACT|nr:MBOAT family O-acyltransferase [Oceaniferula flavus]MBK1853713.1 MBOAT family protein [Oceaniferula flavus]MBM1135019.1 MBOAT family protein [Oceaniferula flavus]
MLFNSYAFWLFFALVWVIYRLLPHRGQNLMLLGASYYFYACWDWRFLPLILTTTLVNYFTAIGMEKSTDPKRHKWLMAASAVVSLGLLAYFKYFGFFAESAAELLSWLGFQADIKMLNIILPVGISFYTFQTMSYTIDVYRKQIKPTHSLADFALYVAYFPQLVAGPIERSSSLLPQITNSRKNRPHGDFSEGLYLVMLGLFLKVVVGDNLGFIADGIFSAEKGDLTGTEALVGVYCFAFQIYGDFAGYSSIARGVSKWLGIDLMTNFRMPYLARNPSDFWQRWHISLSSWLRDYLYIPLGGNRGSKFMVYRNLMITMLLGGLWHGAGWTFLIWGGLHGAILCIYRVLGDRVKLPDRWGRIVATLFFFHLVCLTWLFFRADTLPQAWEMLTLIFTQQEMTPLANYGLRMLVFFCAPLMAYEIWLDQAHTLRRLESARWGWRAAAYCYFVFMLIVFPPPVFGQFIYFQF